MAVLWVDVVNALKFVSFAISDGPLVLLLEQSGASLLHAPKLLISESNTIRLWQKLAAVSGYYKFAFQSMASGALCA